MLPDDGNGLSGCDVVAWLPVVIAWDGIEMLRDNMLATRKPVTTAHGGNYGRLSGGSRSRQKDFDARGQTVCGKRGRSGLSAPSLMMM
jgi:hypothetical protein